MDVRKHNEGNSPATERDSYFISIKTYHNLIVLTYGFIGYANKVIKQYDSEYYIPALHCNQSSIEGLSSCIGMMSIDRTDLYARVRIEQNIHLELKAVKSSRFIIIPINYDSK